MERIVFPNIPNYHKLDVYVANGGYKAAIKAF